MGILYHYTSVETLYKILNNIHKEHDKEFIKLHANYFMNMNDPADCQYFVSVLSEILTNGTNMYGFFKKQFEIAMHEAGIPYFVSLSSERDSLPMWHMYADSAHGVAIGFSEKLLNDAVGNFQNIGPQEQKALSTSAFCKLYNCEYWTKEEINEKIIVANNIRTDKTWRIMNILTRDACNISYAIKHPKYAYEKESRIIFMVSFPYKGWPNFFEFYVPINAIEEIICGPCADEGFVKAVVPKELHQIVKKSEVPYTDSPNNTIPRHNW